jgi:hypothetical protein
LLRPITLLTVEDQIAYQAMINVVAERLHPKVKHRYSKEVFGHTLAGKSSIWFYKKWKTCYAGFNAAARRAFEEGFVYAAHFDLAAFYDSLDHGVLCHFLKVLRCDKDFLDLLVRCLNTWTSTQGSIYHNHGIPQGPINSGLLSALSHPVKTTGRARIVVGTTGRIKFSYIHRARKLVRTAVKELAGMNKW